MPGKRKHIVQVMRPTEAIEGHGELRGQDGTVYCDWPCSIEPLTTREAEVARQLVPMATHKIAGSGEPARPIKHGDYITYRGTKFEIGSVLDKDMDGTEYELTCVELPNG